MPDRYAGVLILPHSSGVVGRSCIVWHTFVKNNILRVSFALHCVGTLMHRVWSLMRSKWEQNIDHLCGACNYCFWFAESFLQTARGVGC